MLVSLKDVAIMKLQIFIIDEPIHIESEMACRLWQKALWAKEQGYRQHYKTAIMPVSVDDFFGTHYIIAEQKPNGDYEPVAMTKSVRRSQSERFAIPFSVDAVIQHINQDERAHADKILGLPAEISYESSWSINPIYQKNRELSIRLRNYMTLYACYYFKSAGISRWLTAGVTQFKIDKYFEWLGGSAIASEFSLSIIDNQTVRLMYIENAFNAPAEPLAIAETLLPDWENRIIFQPKNKKELNHVLRAA